MYEDWSAKCYQINKKTLQKNLLKNFEVLPKKKKKKMTIWA